MWSGDTGHMDGCMVLWSTKTKFSWTDRLPYLLTHGVPHMHLWCVELRYESHIFELKRES